MNRLEILKNDPYLKKIIEDGHLSDELLESHLNMLLRVYESRSLCMGCKGLEGCRQMSEGERLSLSYDGLLLEEIEYCDYALVKQDKDMRLNSYVYSNISESMIDNDLYSIEYMPEQKNLYLRLAAILTGKSRQGLYIYGDMGVGKTYLCIALANSLLAKNEKVAFARVPELVNELRSLVVSGSSQNASIINRLKKVSYLFLDDIGSESVSEFVREDVLFQILDYRMHHELTTIFTSNLSKEDLLVHYQYDRKKESDINKARRLMARINALGEDFVLTGKDLRRKW